MNINKLISAKRGVVENHEFKGHLLFSLGQPGTTRPDRFGSIYVFNDDVIFPDAYVGMHPHKETEIITIMLAGKESHSDSLGNYQELTAGDVQLISSGTGIRHAGGNLSSTESSRHLQIWIEPKSVETAPTLQLKHRKSGADPDIWNLLVSPDGEAGSLFINQLVWISEGSFSGGEISCKMKNVNNGLLIYVLNGQIKMENGATAEQEDTLFIIAETEKVIFHAEQTCRLLVIETALTR